MCVNSSKCKHLGLEQLWLAWGFAQLKSNCTGNECGDCRNELHNKWIVGFPYTFDVSSLQHTEFMQLRSAVSAASVAEPSLWSHSEMKACCSDLETLLVLNPTAPSAAQMLSAKCHYNSSPQRRCLSSEGFNHQHKERGIYWLSVFVQ